MNRSMVAQTKIGQIMVNRASTIDLLSYISTSTFNSPYRGIILPIDNKHDPLWWRIFYHILLVRE